MACEGFLAALAASQGGRWTIDLLVTCEKGQRVGAGDQRLAKQVGVLGPGRTLPAHTDPDVAALG